ncbi:DUF89 domain-containing protein [Gaertneriomyces semiglobifer]|nr:DUF89 domain-containing protein [Gaertneriomyces semiglobifer]
MTDDFRVEPLHPYPSGILPLRGTVKGSFAYLTFKERLPIIITKVVDSLSRTLHRTTGEQHAPEAVKEAKGCIEQLSKLTYEIQRDRKLLPLNDGDQDVALWNKLIQDLPAESNTWFSAPWLFAECYLYRKLREIFNNTTAWKDLDIFAKDQKEPVLLGSWKSASTLADHLTNMQSQSLDENARRVTLWEFLQFSLWGNQTDLSLLTNVKHADIHEIQRTSTSHLHKAEQHIIVNDGVKVLDYLQHVRNGRVDIVLDNAGFELFADLCLADWLIHDGIADTVVFHVKAFPWFVSDTTPQDFEFTLKTLVTLAEADSNAALVDRVGRWRAWLQEKKWVVIGDPFWTLPYSFWQLPTVGSSIYREICQANLTIFKGDLNYRKLVYDAEWPTTTSFREALGPLAQRSTPPILALRTCKSDVAVGLSSGQEKELDQKDPAWMVNGKWGMIQFEDTRA